MDMLTQHRTLLQKFPHHLCAITRTHKRKHNAQGLHHLSKHFQYYCVSMPGSFADTRCDVVFLSGLLLANRHPRVGRSDLRQHIGHAFFVRVVQDSEADHAPVIQQLGDGAVQALEPGDCVLPQLSNQLSRFRNQILVQEPLRGKATSEPSQTLLPSR